MQESQTSHQDVDRRILGQDAQYLDAHFERRMDQYKVILANTSELLKIFLRMRHQVFCEEHPEYEESQRLNLLEQDEHDHHSLHFLVMYEPLHMIVGGTRVILPRAKLPWNGLPSVEAEGSYFREGFPYDLSRFCEISRFLLVRERMKLVRAHQGESRDQDNYPDVFRHMVRTVFSVCKEMSLTGFVGTLEESLFRRSKIFFGISMTKFGEPFEYHGKRQGGYIILEDALEEFRKFDMRVYHFICDGEIPALRGGAHGE